MGSENKIKNLIVFSSGWAFCGLLAFGCQKYSAGCTDTTADNYSNLAKHDDGSCIYLETTKRQNFSTTDASWTFDGTNQIASFSWEELTQEVADKNQVSFYVLNNTGWIGLPYTFYQTSTYSSTIAVEYGVNSFNIIWTDSDLTNPGNPGILTFKAVIIS